jgi:hypothetical protein
MNDGIARGTIPGMSQAPARFQLFLDESGDFRETSTDAAERALTSNGPRPSQLAGLLVPDKRLTREAAVRLLGEACAKGGCQYTDAFHATKLGRDAVEAAIEDLLPKLADRTWQPVRLVNREQVAFGDRVTTYTNLVAELVLRCFQNLRLLGLRDIEIDLHCAGVWDEVEQRTFQHADYTVRLHEVLARAAIRAGQAEHHRRWRLGAFHFRSGKRDPEIHLCDLLSNASFHDFQRLQEGARQRFQAALGRYDMTLQVREDLQRIDELAAVGSTGLAIIHIAERLLDGSTADRLGTDLRRRLFALVQDLAAIGAPARDVQLQGIATHLEQTIQWERDLEHGRKHAEWCLREVAVPLRDQLPEAERGEVAWFEFALHLRRLIASNHLGDLATAGKVAADLQQLQPAIVSRWERLDLFLQAQIHVAVHQTDCRELRTAIETAQRVARFHAELGELFHAAMPGLPEHVRSKRRGEALGTAMQAAMLLGLETPDAFAEARALGDEALQQFDSASDSARQFQYRCQLETLADDSAAALGWLATAAHAPGDSPEAVFAAIAAEPSGSASRGFLLLHALRCLAFASQQESGPLAKSLHAAWQGTQLATDPWCQGEQRDHPGPWILCYLGITQAVHEDADAATRTLQRLRAALLPLQTHKALLAMPLLALQTYMAMAWNDSDPARVRNLVDQRSDQAPGLVQLLEILTNQLRRHPQWMHRLAAWQPLLAQLRKGAGRSLRHDVKRLLQSAAF